MIKEQDKCVSQNEDYAHSGVNYNNCELLGYMFRVIKCVGYFNEFILL